jgi:hypothetical protein
VIAAAAVLVGSAMATLPAGSVTLTLRENYDFSTIDWLASDPISAVGTWEKVF